MRIVRICKSGPEKVRIADRCLRTRSRRSATKDAAGVPSSWHDGWRGSRGRGQWPEDRRGTRYEHPVAGLCGVFCALPWAPPAPLWAAEPVCNDTPWAQPEGSACACLWSAAVGEGAMPRWRQSVPAAILRSRRLDFLSCYPLFLVRAGLLDSPIHYLSRGCGRALHARRNPAHGHAAGCNPARAVAERAEHGAPR